MKSHKVISSLRIVLLMSGNPSFFMNMYTAGSYFQITDFLSCTSGVDASPLMTWGSIEGTPFRLDGGDTPIAGTPGPIFKMPEPKKRDQLGIALAEKVSRQHREKRRQALATATAMIGRYI